MNKLKLFLLIIFSFACVPFASSQESAPEAGFFIDYTGDEPRFFQRIVWEKDDYALRYEVIIQIYSNGFREYSRRITEDFFLEISLPPGNYRYRIVPFDLLDLRGDSSDWAEFSILAGYRPVIEKYVPETFFLDQRQERALYLTGVNLLSDSIYILEGERTLEPVQIEILNDGRVKLFFDDWVLETGDYDIVVKNPGGLEDHAKGFSISYRKPMYTYFNISYTPSYPLYGDLLEKFGENFYTSAAFNIELLTTSRTTFNGGMGLCISASLFNCTFSDMKNGLLSEETALALYDFSMYVSLQKRFFYSRMAITSRFGFGLSFFDDETDVTEMVVNYMISLTYSAMLYKNLFIEAGADFMHYGTTETTGAIKPRIGLTLQF